MKRFILFFLSVWGVALSLPAQEIDVFLIGGQSNATGQGYVRNIPAAFRVDTTVGFIIPAFSIKVKAVDSGWRCVRLPKQKTSSEWS